MTKIVLDHILYESVTELSSVKYVISKVDSHTD